MNQQDLKGKIDGLTQAILARVPTVPDKDEQELAQLLLSVVQVVGELLLDVKRIADAAQYLARKPVDDQGVEPWAAPGLDLEPLARFLAGKEAFRKIMDDVTLPELTARRKAWVDANWCAFRQEADELLAAASGAVS